MPTIPRKLVSLVFKASPTEPAQIRKGYLFNRVYHGEMNTLAIARELYANTLVEERAICLGYCIDDGSFDCHAVPDSKIKKF